MNSSASSWIFSKLLFEARLGAYSHTRLKARDHRILNLSLVEKAETVQVQITLQGEGLRAQFSYHE